MSGVRPRATRSSVQKSPTVTTGFALPMVGKMLGPWTSAPIGHRRYARRESGSRNVTSANSANAEGELPVDMDAHLLRDLGPLVVHDDDVPLPIFRGLAPAQGTFVLVGHVTAVLTRLRDLHDRALDDLLQCRREHEGVVPHPLVDRPVPVDDPALADALDVARDQREGLVRPDLAFQRGAGELPSDRVDVFAESLRRDPDDVFPLDPLVHENRLAAVPVPPI